jgi:hypothetical protein
VRSPGANRREELTLMMHWVAHLWAEPLGTWTLPDLLGLLAFAAITYVVGLGAAVAIAAKDESDGADA